MPTLFYRNAETVFRLPISRRPPVGSDRSFFIEVQEALALVLGGIVSGDSITIPDRQRTLATDEAFTLTWGVDAPEQRHIGTLTAARAVTLATTNAVAGAKFRITRSGGGAFNLNVGTGPLKAMAAGIWAEFVFDGTAWYLAASGPVSV